MDDKLSEAAVLLLRGLADDEDGLERRGSEGGPLPAKRRRLAVQQDATAALRLGRKLVLLLCLLPLRILPLHHSCCQPHDSQPPLFTNTDAHSRVMQAPGIENGSTVSEWLTSMEWVALVPDQVPDEATC